MVTAFTQIVVPHPRGSSVEVADGRTVLVAAVDPDDVTRPTVRVLHSHGRGEEIARATLERSLLAA